MYLSNVPLSRDRNSGLSQCDSIQRSQDTQASTNFTPSGVINDNFNFLSLSGCETPTSRKSSTKKPVTARKVQKRFHNNVAKVDNTSSIIQSIPDYNIALINLDESKWSRSSLLMKRQNLYVDATKNFMWVPASKGEVIDSNYPVSHKASMFT